MPNRAFRTLLRSAALCALLTAPSLADGISGPYLAARQAGISSDYKEAARYALRTVDARPENQRLKENAVLALVASGDLSMAATIAAEHKTAGGTNQMIDLVLTAKALSEGQFDHEFTTPSDNNLIVLINGLLQGWAALGQGNMGDASGWFEGTAETQDFAQFARFHEGLALALVGDFEGAEAIFSGEKYGPLALSARGIAAHAQILSQLERGPDAVELLRAATRGGMIPVLGDLMTRIEAGETVPFDIVGDAKDGAAEVFFNVASALSGQSPGDHVLLYARMAQMLRPDHVDAAILIAENMSVLRQYDLASEAYALVPSGHPNAFLAEMGRADALFADDQKEAAAEVMQALSRSHPENPVVLAKYGDTLSRIERDAEAIKAFTRAIDLRDPSDPLGWAAYYRRGIVHERIKNYEEMEADFRKALELSPDHPDVLNYLGYSLVEQRIKLDEALAMIQKAVELRPESGYITDSLAWVYYRLGRFEEAVEPMERAAELLPVDPIINDHLGDIYYMVGRVREAEFQWKRALSFDPAEEDAARILRKLDVGLTQVLEDEGGVGAVETAND